MPYDFDTIYDRSATGSYKWTKYPADVLPMWVADMDFRVAPVIEAAVRRRADTLIYGYTHPPMALREQIVADMAERYAWHIKPEDILFMPGVVPGFNLAIDANLDPGDGLAIQVPVYPPIFRAPQRWRMTPVEDGFVDNGGPGWQVDFDSFGRAMGQSKAFLLSNPHNPLGKVFTQQELEAMATACLANGTLILSDEIHCDLLFTGQRHIPMASLAPEIAQRTITLMSAGKTYNIAGLKACWLIIQNPELRTRMANAIAGVADGVNMFGLDATLAALKDGGDWKQALMVYLEANRDHLAMRVARDLPGVSMKLPEATYLAWLDCRALGLQEEAYDFFLREAKVGMNPGLDFGPQGAGHVRLNFGCPRATLDQALDRMAAAIQRR